MNNSLEKRYALLKARFGGEPVTLHLQDGTVRQINGSSKHFLKLCALLDHDGPSPLDPEIEWIRDANRIDEPAHVFELLQVLLQGPNMEAQEPEL